MFIVMKLTGLGLACLSSDQIYATAVNAGFPPNVAVTMTAIALRESGGCPSVVNKRAPGANGPSDPGEDSRGLWQINTRAVPALVTSLGGPDALSDPAINAMAAFQMWGGSDANLDIAWYVNRPVYREAYERFLPEALAAAERVSGGVIDDVGAYDPPYPAPSTASAAGISMGAVALGLAGLFLLTRES